MLAGLSGLEVAVMEEEEEQQEVGGALRGGKGGWFSGHLVAEVSQQPVQNINAEKRERIKLKKLEVKEML